MARVTSDVAFDYIRQRILSGEFPMGYALKTNALSLAIGVSRTPIRDALRQLEAEGLVEIEPHFGANVKSLDVSEFSEICMMRMALESFLAGMAAELRTDIDLREINLAMETMHRLTDEIRVGSDGVETALFPELARQDIRFHMAIMTAARKPRIKKEVLRLHLINRVLSWERTTQTKLGVANRAMREEDRAGAIISHQEIYQAIRQGHAAAAREAMAGHIQHIIDVNLSRMSQLNPKLLVPKNLSDKEQHYSH